MEDFTVFSISEIRKIESQFHRRRLNEWQDKGYIKKVVKGYYVFSDSELNAIFLFGRTAPNYDYLQFKANIANMSELKEVLLSKYSKLDFERLSRDVEPFLINPGDSRKILLFREYIKNVDEKT